MSSVSDFFLSTVRDIDVLDTFQTLNVIVIL